MIEKKDGGAQEQGQLSLDSRVEWSLVREQDCPGKVANWSELLSIYIPVERTDYSD